MPGTAVSESIDTQTESEAALPSVRVVNAVAVVADEDPLTMAPLYDVVDPDALDRLLDGEIDGQVQFAYAGHEVTVYGHGAVVVDGEEVA